MKSTLMRPALVLALALGLASCGGKAGFTVAGEVSGLQYTGLKLSTNGMTIPVEPAAAPSTGTVKFAFPNDLEYGEEYDVTIATPPQFQTCALDHTAKNTAGRLTTINVTVACALKTNSVSGTVTGLKNTGLQLINGSSGIVSVAPSTTADDPTFTFPNIPYGQAYGITVYANPTGQVCNVVSANGTGTMDANGVEKGITGVLVRCN